MKSAIAIAFVFALGLQGCGGAAADSLTNVRGAPAPRQIVAIIDLSGSRTPAEITKSQAFLETLLNQASFGDRLVVLVAHSSGRRDSSFSWSDTMPTARNPAEPTPGDNKKLNYARTAAKAAIKLAFKGSTSRPHTDLVATLFSVADHLKSSPERRPVLVFMSDMLNSTSTLNMERQAASPALVTQWVKQGLIPKLSQSCVVVVGAEDGTAPALRVREFWTAFFGAAGATLNPEDYRYEATDAQSFECFANA